MPSAARHRRATDGDHWALARYAVQGSTLVGVGAALALAALPPLAHGDAPETWDLTVTIAVGLFGWLLGYLLATAASWLPGAIVLGVVVCLFAIFLPASLSGAATAPPLGYANANGALLAIAAAGIVAASLRRSASVAGGAAAAALMLAGGCAMTGSRAASVVCVGLGVSALALRHGSRLGWQLVTVVAAGAGVALTVGIGATFSPLASPSLIAHTVSTVRAALWSDALKLAWEAPVVGIGPGNFAVESALASADPDLAHAHSTPLQVLAELGVLGFGLLVVLFLAVVWRLGRASVIFALLCLQPMIDYTLDFAAVVVAAAAVLGGLAARCPVNHASRTTTAQMP